MTLLDPIPMTAVTARSAVLTIAIVQADHIEPAAMNPDSVLKRNARTS